MEMSPTPPKFDLTYNQGTSNIGEGYAKGITAAGTSLSSAIGGVFDIANRNQNVNDTLSAMQQSKMLSPDQYQAVMGKSLGARESMLGMYASQWIADQAAQRQLGLAQGTGGVEVDVAHRKLLDTINAVKSGYGAAAGVQPGKLQLQQPQQNQPGQPAPVLQPLGGRGAPPLSNALSGTTANPTPLGSAGITNPPLVTSPQLQAATAARAAQPITRTAPIGAKDAIPGHWIHGAFKGEQGYFDPRANEFHPFK